MVCLEQLINVQNYVPREGTPMQRAVRLHETLSCERPVVLCVYSAPPVEHFLPGKIYASCLEMKNNKGSHRDFLLSITTRFSPSVIMLPLTFKLCPPVCCRHFWTGSTRRLHHLGVVPQVKVKTRVVNRKGAAVSGLLSGTFAPKNEERQC